MAWFLLGPLLALGVPGVLVSVASAALSNGAPLAAVVTLIGFWTALAIALGVVLLRERLTRLCPLE